MAVEFNEPTATVSRRVAEARKSSWSLTTLLMKTGLVKTEAGAQTILLVITALALIGAVFFFTSSTQGPPVPTPEQVVL